MLKSLTIKNFRCFEEFELKQLGRVNLLVGKNNSGKTSVLEAIHILDSVSPIPFWQAIERRGEYSGNNREIDIYAISHFCFGYKFLPEKRISIVGDRSDGYDSFKFFIAQELTNGKYSNTETTIGLLRDSTLESLINRVGLEWTHFRKTETVYSMPLNLSLELSSFEISNKAINNRNMFVSLSSFHVAQTIELFNQVVLTPCEEILYEALRFIEPKIARIATTTIQGSGRENHGGFVVSIDGKRVPIGSMGDGIWRMLEITLAMVNIPGGTLLIDEIDTGLHFSVMIDLWKLICKTAEKLDIQVFATTHNSDCWKSLAEVANSDDITSDDITIHRIERGKKASVMFNEREMAIAADRDIEVR
jgi:AAA15 family ATPase/GTPase